MNQVETFEWMRQEIERLTAALEKAREVASRQLFLSNPIRCAYCNKDFYNDETKGQIEESHFTDCILIELRAALAALGESREEVDNV